MKYTVEKFCKIISSSSSYLCLEPKIEKNVRGFDLAMNDFRIACEARKEWFI